MLSGVLNTAPHVVHGGGGVTCVTRKCLQPRTWCYPGKQFNLLDRSPIPGTNPDPVPAGDWGADLRGSSVSGTLKRQLRCICLTTPVLAKGVLPFYLPQTESIERARLGLTSLLFHPLKEKRRKMFPLVVAVLTVLVFLDLLPPGQE